jgi:hypothetical protein
LAIVSPSKPIRLDELLFRENNFAVDDSN